MKRFAQSGQCEHCSAFPARVTAKNHGAAIDYAPTTLAREAVLDKELETETANWSLTSKQETKSF